MINNFLDVTVVEPLNLGAFSPALAGRIYPLPIQSVGNPDLNEEKVDAYEIGYTGVVAGRATLSAAFYVNKMKNDIFFTELTDAALDGDQPAAGLAAAAGGDRARARRQLPGAVHLSELRQDDAEGPRARRRQRAQPLRQPVRRTTRGRESRSPTDFDVSELNLPAENRFNVGVSFNYQRVLGERLASTTPDDAFWQDVLDARYHGTTEAYTLVNGGFGVRWIERPADDVGEGHQPRRTRTSSSTSSATSSSGRSSGSCG